MRSTNGSPRGPEVISTCPVCGGELHVKRLQCGTCGTAIEGQFSVGRFGRLNREQLALLESFLRTRGNLRELERELGISYPTVRNRLEALLRVLGLDDSRVASGATEPAHESMTTVDTNQRREVLERLARHEISAEDAAAELSGPRATTNEEPVE